MLKPPSYKERRSQQARKGDRKEKRRENYRSVHPQLSAVRNQPESIRVSSQAVAAPPSRSLSTRRSLRSISHRHTLYTAMARPLFFFLAGGGTGMEMELVLALLLR